MAHTQLRCLILSLANSLCCSTRSLSRQCSRSRKEQWTDSGRGLQNDQPDRSLPRGRELNLDFTGRRFKITRICRMVPLSIKFYTESISYCETARDLYFQRQ